MNNDAATGPLTIQQALSFSGVGDNIVIPGIFGKTIKVLEMFFICGSASVITFKSGTTALSGAMSFVQGGSFFMDLIELSITCNPSDGFVINSTAGQVSGMIWYTQS